MALVDSESFGSSYNAADFLTYSAWSLGGGLTTPGSVICPLQVYGSNALQITNGVRNWVRTLAAGTDTFYWGGRMFVNITGSSGWGMTFNDPTGVNQLGFGIASTGIITVLRGMTLNNSGYTGGTSLGTTANVFPSSAWVYVEFGAFIDATTGWVIMRINGAEVFNQSGINTKGSGASALVQRYGFRPVNGNNNINMLTHCYFCDATGSVNNSFLGDVVVRPLSPNANSAVQFAATPGLATFILPDGGSNSALSGSNMRMQRVPAPISGQLTNLVMQTGGTGTGNSNLALYEDIDGTPGALLATGTAKASVINGTNVYAVSGGPSLQAGKTYWVALLADFIFNCRTVSGNQHLARNYARTWGSGFPSTMFDVRTTPHASGLRFGMEITASANWEVASDRAPGTTPNPYNLDLTIGNTDLFTMTPLGYIPESIYGVTIKLISRQNGANARSAATVIEIGSTTDAGASVALGATYTNIQTVYNVNPDTSAGWTIADLNSLLIGYKVAA
jgi:hypothetical protein